MDLQQIRPTYSIYNQERESHDETAAIQENALDIKHTDLLFGD